MNSYTIINDFHGTEVTIRCEGLSHIWNEVEIRPSVSQIKKMQKKLCGISDCQCSGEDGSRGISRTSDGKRIIVDCSALYAAKK